MHKANCFITLTYSDENLPENGSLRKEDLTLFWKRMRKAGVPFRYYACGEYGDNTGRPHYHACVFGYDFSPDRKLFSKNKRGEKLYVSDFLQRKWQKGHCLIGDLTYESAAYVARYVMKKLTGGRALEYGSRTPPFGVMSKGIGAEWFEKYRGDIFPADEAIYNGRRHRPPRYYDLKLEESELEEFKEKRRKAASKFEYDLTPERLKVREVCLEQRADNLKRRI